jgi:hypothetical protein
VEYFWSDFTPEYTEEWAFRKTAVSGRELQKGEEKKHAYPLKYLLQ